MDEMEGRLRSIYNPIHNSSEPLRALKYPSVWTPRELEKNVEKYGLEELLEKPVFVEPKYDGSNITVYRGVFLTRNHNPLTEQFSQGLNEALGDSLHLLVELSNEYQVFLELGGTRNSPAGYREAWRGEWDYVIFDLYDHNTNSFLEPPRAREIVGSYGLRFIEYHTPGSLAEIHNDWRNLLDKYKGYEGFVAKIYLPREETARWYPIVRHGVVMVKYKHEEAARRKGKERKHSGQALKLPAMPDSEILGIINKVHMEIGDKVRNPRDAMPLIGRLVKEEARKHGYAEPPGGRVYRLWARYLKEAGLK